jgi:hypothetical protein
MGMSFAYGPAAVGRRLKFAGQIIHMRMQQPDSEMQLNEKIYHPPRTNPGRIRNIYAKYEKGRFISG